MANRRFFSPPSRRAVGWAAVANNPYQSPETAGPGRGRRIHVPSLLIGMVLSVPIAFVVFELVAKVILIGELPTDSGDSRHVEIGLAAGAGAMLAVLAISCVVVAKRHSVES